ncbi:MAG: hypothetical protein WCK89_02690 [bacterium]
MNRKETLEQEYNARAGRTRIDSALPPAGVCRHRSYWGMIVLVIVLLVAAGVAGWLMYGGR